ncbi:MAG: hypothetical protein ACLP1X_33445 [Polyangiaceae bacterium]|jgi:hypothetical protein
MKKSVRFVAGLAIVGVSTAPCLSWAQAAPAPTALPVLPPTAPPPVTVAPPTPPPAPPAAPPPIREPVHENDDEATLPDHDRFIKHLGITYFDVTTLPIANPVTANSGGGGAPTLTPGGITSSTVAAPVVGIRYWLQRTIGIDVGLGLGFAGGSQEAVTNGADTTVNKVGTSGFALHGGLPIVIYEGRHYAFLVIPEFTVGGASGKLTPTTPPGGIASPEQDLSGFLLDMGGKVGAEIYFGFIGLPELALQATVGLSYRRSVFKLSSGGNSASDGTTTFGTDVGSDPWAIFTNNISATYYF